jgi:hypothetical protein
MILKICNYTTFQVPALCAVIFLPTLEIYYCYFYGKKLVILIIG